MPNSKQIKCRLKKIQISQVEKRWRWVEMILLAKRGPRTIRRTHGFPALIPTLLLLSGLVSTSQPHWGAGHQAAVRHSLSGSII